LGGGGQASDILRSNPQIKNRFKNLASLYINNKNKNNSSTPNKSQNSNYVGGDSTIEYEDHDNKNSDIADINPMTNPILSNVQNNSSVYADKLGRRKFS